MMNRLGCLCIALLWIGPVQGIGFVYTGVGGGGRELLEMTAVEVEVDIRERVAVTRVDQIFTNHSDDVLEGIYEFALPSGAIITDLVLWIGEERVQGLIMEKETARRTYDAIVRRNIDPALIEQIDEEQFRLSIFPFPAQGSRRVELEYMQVLEARGGLISYRFPLAIEVEPAPVVGRFILRAGVRSQHAFEIVDNEVFQVITEISREDIFAAVVLFVDEQVATGHDFELTIAEMDEERRPTVLSYPPEDGELGYYALWLPSLSELSRAEPIPRSVVFVVDISSSMRGDKLASVKEALRGAVEALDENDLFNIVTFSNRATTFAVEPVPASTGNREEGMEFVRRQSALGGTNYEAALELAFGQLFPDGRRSHVIFLTDGFPTFGETDLPVLSQLAGEWAGEGARLFTIGVGEEIDRGFLRALAEENLGSSSFLRGEGDIEAELRALFDEFSRPIFLLDDLSFGGMEVYDLFPRSSELLAAGQEFFQVGRYAQGGTFILELDGRVEDRQLALEYPLAFAEGEPGGANEMEDATLFFDEFDGSQAGAWSKAPDTGGAWVLDEQKGVYEVHGVDGISRAHRGVDARTYTIEVRLRFFGWQGKVICGMADRRENFRFDLIAGSGVRLQTGSGLFSLPFGIVAGVWYDVRVEVGIDAVNTYVNGVPLHQGISLGNLVPDGVIGIGSYGSTHHAEFDYVRVLEGVEEGYQPARLDPVARLWAHQKVRALEAEIDRYGAQQEVLDDILDLGLAYRLVTSRTSLFAPDEGAVVNPELVAGEGQTGGRDLGENLGGGGNEDLGPGSSQDERDDVSWSASAVEDSVVVEEWLGKRFYRSTDIWVDVDFEPGMELRDYGEKGGQPAVLENFARLGEHLIVVLDGVAYEVVAGILESLPVLDQNAPNPFNATTAIRFWLPAGMAGGAVSLEIFNLAGQRVRSWSVGGMQVGDNRFVWDGRDESGREMGSGVYVYRLRVGEAALSRRMVLVR